MFIMSGKKAFSIEDLEKFKELLSSKKVEHKPNSNEHFLLGMKSMGYQVGSADGVCFGLSVLSSRAFLLGQLERYNQRVLTLLDIQPEDFCAKVDCHPQKVALLAFLDSIALLQSPADYRAISPILDHSQVLFPAMDLTAPVEFRSGDLPVIVDSVTDKYNTHRLSEHLRLLANHLGRVASFSTVLQYSSHAVALHYDHVSNHWILQDPNDLPGRVFANTPDARDSIFSRLIFNGCDIPGSSATSVITTQLFCLPEHHATMQTGFEGYYKAASESVFRDGTFYTEPDQGGALVLYAAAFVGNLRAVERFIGMGCDVNATLEEDGSSVISVAAGNGHLEVVLLLLKNGANPLLRDYKGINALLLPAQFGYTAVVKALLSACKKPIEPSDNSVMPSHLAAERNHHEILGVLLAHDRTALIECKAQNDVTPLILASQNGCIESVQILLANDAKVDEVDEDGKSALYWAAQNGHKTVVDLLIKHGANPGLECKYGGKPVLGAKHRATPFLVALCQQRTLLAYDMLKSAKPALPEAEEGVEEMKGMEGA